MYRYNMLVKFREKVNELYEEIKILQIITDESIEAIPLTLTEKIYDIEDMTDECLEIHSKLSSDVLKQEDVKDTRRKLIDFKDIKTKLKEILTCLYFLKFFIKNDKEADYNKISDMLVIILKKSSNVISLANKTKLKIYPKEKTKRKSAAKEFDFSKYNMLSKNIIKF